MGKPPRMPMSRERRYGWVPDLPDKRDWLFSAVRKLRRLPPRMDLRFLCSPVEDQGALGSCTAQALVGALELLEVRNRRPYADLSRLFVYYNERVVIGTVREDSGAMLRDGIKTLVKQGVCSEAKWPYVIGKFASRPASSCYREALDHQVTQYRRIETIEEMRICLADGYPFVFGFMVYESFENSVVAQTGKAPMPGRKERALGGHAVMAVGYDDGEKRFLVRNSWGAGWGLAGCFTLPYAYLESRELSDDFWTIRSGEGF